MRNPFASKPAPAPERPIHKRIAASVQTGINQLLNERTKLEFEITQLEARRRDIQVALEALDAAAASFTKSGIIVTDSAGSQSPRPPSLRPGKNAAERLADLQPLDWPASGRAKDGGETTPRSDLSDQKKDGAADPKLLREIST